MPRHEQPSAELISEFLNGRVTGEDSASIEKYLLAHPTALTEFSAITAEDEEMIASLRNRTSLKYSYFYFRVSIRI